MKKSLKLAAKRQKFDAYDAKLLKIMQNKQSEVHCHDNEMKTNTVLAEWAQRSVGVNVCEMYLILYRKKSYYLPSEILLYRHEHKKWHRPLSTSDFTRVHTPTALTPRRLLLPFSFTQIVLIHV